MTSNRADVPSIDTSPLGVFAPAVDYMIDAAQRSILFWDVMRQRGNQYREHLAETAPHVLDYEASWSSTAARSRVRSITCWSGSFRRRASRSIRNDGRSSWSTRAPGTARASAASRPTARSGSRSRPDIPAISSASCRIPMPGQTIEDIARAEAIFLEKVIALHPRRRRQTLRDRQLPGRLGGHDARRAAARIVRPHHRRRIAALLLGRRARQVSDALYRRPAWAAAG